jgi:hypothetical protein
MKIESTTTKRVTLADGLIVTLTIDGDGQIRHVQAVATGDAVVLPAITAETFDRIAAVVDKHRIDANVYPYRVKAPRVCADHGHHENHECPKCKMESDEQAAIAANQPDDAVPAIPPRVRPQDD